MAGLEDHERALDARRARAGHDGLEVWRKRLVGEVAVAINHTR
jgi:hypothetical protein